MSNSDSKQIRFSCQSKRPVSLVRLKLVISKAAEEQPTEEPDAIEKIPKELGSSDEENKTNWFVSASDLSNGIYEFTALSSQLPVYTDYVSITDGLRNTSDLQLYFPWEQARDIKREALRENFEKLKLVARTMANRSKADDSGTSLLASVVCSELSDSFCSRQWNRVIDDIRVLVRRTAEKRRKRESRKREYASPYELELAKDVPAVDAGWSTAICALGIRNRVYLQLAQSVELGPLWTQWMFLRQENQPNETTFKRLCESKLGKTSGVFNCRRTAFLGLIQIGVPDSEIAKVLGVTPPTVSEYWQAFSHDLNAIYGELRFTDFLEDL